MLDGRDCLRLGRYRRVPLRCGALREGDLDQVSGIEFVGVCCRLERFILRNWYYLIAVERNERAISRYSASRLVFAQSPTKNWRISLRFLDSKEDS